MSLKVENKLLQSLGSCAAGCCDFLLVSEACVTVVVIAAVIFTDQEQVYNFAFHLDHGQKTEEIRRSSLH